MSALAPDLFQRRFADLMDIGRARLRSLAPEWTDHNAHDPGITLIELLAWVAEAQLYSLSRLRRDERTAYAALLGIAPTGTTAATGLLWADRLDPASPAATYATRVVLDEDTAVNVLGADEPTFRPACKLLWAPGRISALVARGGGGRRIDFTAVNEKGGSAFLPFGQGAGGRSVVSLTFTCGDDKGLFGANREACKGARWAIGVRAAPPPTPTPADSVDTPKVPSPLTATYVADGARVPLNIVADSTAGLLTTGALLMDLDALASTPKEFTIELRAPSGLPRPPRLVRIEPSVIPVRQGHFIRNELHADSTGFPDWELTLEAPGLRYRAGEEPVAIDVAEPGGARMWRRLPGGLADAGPDERVYELDPSARRVTFGNGVNGKIPPAGAQVLVSYAVSDGADGNVARNRRWRVAGFEGAFGINVDPVTGGAAPAGWIDQRRAARRRSHDEHPLVSMADIEAAALALPLLEVVRAWVVKPDDRTPRTGVVTLVALRARPGGMEPEGVPESRRWLDAIRRRLAPRMPLATRLMVVAPRYADFSIRATLEVDPGQDPAAIKKKIEPALRKRLALVSAGAGAPVRPPGVPLTARDVRAWLRAIEGVRRLVSLQLIDAAGREVPQIAPSPGGLPRWNAAASSIEPARTGTGGGA